MKTLAVLLTLTQLLCNCVSWNPVTNYELHNSINGGDQLRVTTQDGQTFKMILMKVENDTLWGVKQDGYIVAAIANEEIKTIENLEDDAVKTFGLASLILGIVVIGKADTEDHQ